MLNVILGSLKNSVQGLKGKEKKMKVEGLKSSMITTNDMKDNALFLSLELAEYVVSYCSKKEMYITNLALQKFLYYIQGYFYKFFQVAAVPDDFCKWPYGPVLPRVYYEFCRYGAAEIVIDSDMIDDSLCSFHAEKAHKRLINTVVDNCLKYKVFDLVGKTHQEAPWNNNRKMGSLISDDVMQEFFSLNNPLAIKYN